MTLVVLLQDALHDGLPTRVVAPLVPIDQLAAPIRGLHLEIEVAGERYRLLTNELASLPATDLGPALVQLGARRSELLAALDLLTTGI